MADSYFTVRSGAEEMCIRDSAGIEAVSTGTAEIATSSRGLNAEEQKLGLTTIPVAHDGIAVIVNTALSLIHI